MTDFLLLDPVSRFANWIARGDGWAGGWGCDEIAYRNVFTVML